MGKGTSGGIEELSVPTQVGGPRFNAGDVVILINRPKPTAAKVVMSLMSTPGIPEFTYLIEYFVQAPLSKAWDLIEREVTEDSLIPLDPVSKLLYLDRTAAPDLEHYSLSNY